MSVSALQKKVKIRCVQFDNLTSLGKGHNSKCRKRMGRTFGDNKLSLF